MPAGMLVSANSWDRSQRTRTPSKRAYGYDPKELLASKPSSGTRQASAGSSECADAAQSASAGHAGAAAAGQARQASALRDAELGGRTAHQQRQPSQHADGDDVAGRGLSAQQPFQQAPAMPPLPKLAIWQLEPPAQPARPPGGMRSVWQCPQAARKPRTGVRTLEVPVHVGFSIQGLSAALHRSKDGGGSAAGRSSDATSSEDDLPAILQTGSRYPQPSRQQSIHKKGQVCALQKGHNCATLMSTPCMTWWPAPGAANGVMCSDCRTKFGHHCPHDSKCEPCFLRLRGAKPAPGGAVPRQRAAAQPAAVPAEPALATAPPLSRLMRGLKQLAAAKPPTKESTQIKELVAAYEAELAVTHRSNTLPAGAGWRASRPLLPPNFAPKPPRHAPPTAAAAAARTGGATLPLCRPLQLQGTSLQQAAAAVPKPAAPSSDAGLAGPTGTTVCHACKQPAAPAGQPPAWQSMAATSQQPKEAGPAAPAALPSVAASAGGTSARANAALPVRRADSSPGRKAPAPVQRDARQHQKAPQLAGERAAGQPDAAAASPGARQQPTTAGGQAAAAAGISDSALVGAPSTSTYKSFPGVCQRVPQKQAAAHPPADPDPDIQALVAAKALADGEIVQYRIPHGQGSDSASPAAAAGMEAPTSGSLGSSSAGGGTPSVRSSGHDPVLASAVVDAATGGLRCRRCRAVVTPAQLQRGCAGAKDGCNPLARIFTRGKRSVRRSLLELLAGLRKDEPSCASAPAASVDKKRHKVDEQAQHSSGIAPTEVATLATQQPCATVEASGAASGGAFGSSNGSGSVAGAPPPGTPDTVSPSRPPGSSAGARARRKRSSTDPSGPDATALPADAPAPSPLPQPGRPNEMPSPAAKRRRRSGTASASGVETLVVELSSSSGEASAPAASAALPKSSGASGPGRRKRSAATGSPASTATPPADGTPLAPGAQAAMAAWRAQQALRRVAAQQPDARRTRSSSSREAASGSPAQGPPLAPAARAAAEAVRRQQAAAKAWAQQELAADEAGLGTRSNPVSVASGPVEPLSGSSKRSSRHRRSAAADPICLLSSSEESGDVASDGGGRDAGGIVTASPRRTRASQLSASGSKGGNSDRGGKADRQHAGDGVRSSSRSMGGNASGAAKPPSVTRAAASVAAAFAIGTKEGGNASASREGGSAGTSGAATDAEGERPKKAPRRMETQGSLKRSLAPAGQSVLHQSKRHRTAIVA